MNNFSVTVVEITEWPPILRNASQETRDNVAAWLHAIVLRSEKMNAAQLSRLFVTALPLVVKFLERDPLAFNVAREYEFWRRHNRAPRQAKALALSLVHARTHFEEAIYKHVRPK